MRWRSPVNFIIGSWRFARSLRAGRLMQRLRRVHFAAAYCEISIFVNNMAALIWGPPGSVIILCGGCISKSKSSRNGRVEGGLTSIRRQK